MIASASASVSEAPLPIIPVPNRLYCDVLRRVQGHTATIGPDDVEVPPEIAGELLPMVGHDVLLGLVGGHFRAGLQSHRRPWL